MKHLTSSILCIAFGAFVLIGSAYAQTCPTDGTVKDGVCLAPGNDASLFHPHLEENVLFNKPGPTVGNTIDGHTNRTNNIVQFFSASTVLEAMGGQSDIDAENGGLIQDLTVSLPGGEEFKDFIMNPFKENAPNILTVTVVSNDGTAVFHFDDSTHGNNFMTIFAQGANFIKSIAITQPAGDGFESFKQPRISGVAGATVSEPSSLLLLGSGLLGFASKLRRKKEVC